MLSVYVGRLLCIAENFALYFAIKKKTKWNEKVNLKEKKKLFTFVQIKKKWNEMIAAAVAAKSEKNKIKMLRFNVTFSIRNTHFFFLVQNSTINTKIHGYWEKSKNKKKKK